MSVSDKDHSKMFDEMHQRNNQQMKRAAELQCEGHRCISFLESFPVQLRHCGKQKCPDAVSGPEEEARLLKLKEAMHFAKSLERKGHVCVDYNGFPQIEWCQGVDVCKKAQASAAKSSSFFAGRRLMMFGGAFAATCFAGFFVRRAYSNNNFTIPK